ncbi:hypothetical protein Vretimale_13447 [Volvox reticuliferus]|uniref:Uncharacterized protein n=1 Tax=Volvox reticuliferus TaxID=1737510 RepID=A0A8J4LU91_9CHLO|nr:hypothetical protein Vretifemale_286 [Volvox reticuliferus]GIM09610.1 hypothetical protein Vretimale_13447 [Volvox reticuliferus]
MPWEFTEHHVRPNVFYWSPTAYNERNEVKTRREQAQSAYKAAKASSDGRHADAEQLLLHCVTAWPDNDKFPLALANCIFLDRGRPAEALEWYNEIVRLKDCPAYRAARSRVLAALGQLEEALEDICEAAKGEPQNPQYAVSRAMLKERLGHFAEARDDYTAALPLLRAAGQPVFESLFNRGYCQKKLGNVDAAIHDMEAALLQSTASMTVRTVLGVLYLSKRRYAKALDLFSVVAQQQTASAAAANNAALAAYLAVTSDFDDSTAATRAASLNQQRARAAMLATGSFKRKAAPRVATGGGAEGAEGGPSSRTSTPVPARRSLAAVVRKARETAAAVAAATASAAQTPTLPSAAAAAAASTPTGTPTERPGSPSRGSLRSSVSLPPLAALLDENIAADQGPLVPPWLVGNRAHSQDREGYQRGSRPDEGLTRPCGEEGGSGEVSNSSSSDEEGGPGRPEVPTVYLPANPRQWAMDIVRDNEVQTVWEPDQRGILEQALRSFDRALANQRALATKKARGGRDGGACGQFSGHGREELDMDTTVLDVGEGGDVPGGLLLVLVHEPRLPGAAVVHDREIDDGEVEYNRGLLLLALGRLSEASSDLDAAQAANPHHAHYPYYQAVVCARRGRDEEAISWDNLALKRNPRYFHALYHLGLVLHLRGEHSEAITRLDAAAALQPRDWRVMEARGRVLQDLDRHTDAVPALKDALAIIRQEEEQPPAVSARLYFALAQSAVAAHQPILLRESLRMARLNGQDPASVYNLRGCLARKERQFSAALRYLTRAVRKSPGEPRFYYDRAQCYLDMALWPEAIDDLSSALDLMPDSPLLLFSRGGAQLAFEAGDVESAAADLARAAELCGGCLRGEGPLWESRKFMSSGSGAPDLSPSLWYHLGCAHSRCGRPREAVAAFQRAAQLMPRHPAFLHELAKACQVIGDHTTALAHFNSVLQLQPNNARALLRRGLSLKCLRRYDEAAADLLAARRLEPSNPLMQLDMRALGKISFIELCAPGEEDDVFVLTKL